MKYKDPDATKDFYIPNALSAFENYFPRDKYADYYDKEFVVTESTNPLIKSGDLMHVYLTDRYFPDCEKYLIVETNHLPKDHAWKFARIDDMKDSKDFDNMDWRQELDDIRNLGRYNFFHLDSFAKLMDSINVKLNFD